MASPTPESANAIVSRPAASAPGGPAGQDPLLFEVLRATCESLPSGLVVFDRTLSVVLRNAVARTLLPADGDVCAMLSKLTISSQYEDWAAEIRKVIETRTLRRFDAVVRPARDQSDVYLALVCTPLRGAVDGEVLGGLILAEDVSAHVSMEQRLAVSERLAALGKLAARVAHELNNPLDGILRFVNLALSACAAPDVAASTPKIAQYLAKAREGLVRMAQITTSLLEFSRTTHTAFEQATINKIVEDAVAALGGRAADSNVTVVCNFHQADMPVVRGSNIFQVFCNLIKNAIDAMPDSGTLTITTRIVGPDAVVTFEDTGVGLPPDADRIFEPFFTTKGPGKGTGLGLAVCREILERYSGSITARPREARGTIVTVKIPTRNCAAVPMDRPLRRRSSMPGATGVDAGSQDSQRRTSQ